jgi:hypothetical protein
MILKVNSVAGAPLARRHAKVLRNTQSGDDRMQQGSAKREVGNDPSVIERIGMLRQELGIGKGSLLAPGASLST